MCMTLSATRGRLHAQQWCSCLVGVGIYCSREAMHRFLLESMNILQFATILLCMRVDLATALTFYYDKVDMRMTMGESL